MSTINSLLESSASGWKNMQNDAARMASKWGKTGLLEGLGSEVNKNNMAMILENQAKQLVTEQSSTNTGGASFTTGTGEQWAGVALPLVRKVFGSLSTKEFMSVQPMNLPSGLVFFLDFQYGDAKQLSFGTGGDVYSTSSMYGNTNPAAGADPSQGLYGAGRFGFSLNQKSSSNLTGAVVKATWADVNYDPTLSASISAGVTYSALSVNMSSLTGSGTTNPDVKGVRAFTATSASIATTGTILPQYTYVNESTATVTFIHQVSSASFASLSPALVFVTYNLAPKDNARGDFEDNSGAGFPNAGSTSTDALAIPEINIQMKSEAIVAKTRKLKAQWTPEFAQDLNAYQSLDAEAELTSIMSEYIALEIDLENLDMLIKDASAADEYWSAKTTIA